MSRAQAKPLFLCLLLLIAGQTFAQESAPNVGPTVHLRPGIEYPRTGSTFTLRVLNRRQIRNILIESDETGAYLSILAVHPRHWAFYAMPHALRHPCGDHRRCLNELRRLDQFLRSGWNLGLRLNGSVIEELIYYPPP